MYKLVLSHARLKRLWPQFIMACRCVLVVAIAFLWDCWEDGPLQAPSLPRSELTFYEEAFPCQDSTNKYEFASCVLTFERTVAQIVLRTAPLFAESRLVARCRLSAHCLLRALRTRPANLLHYCYGQNHSDLIWKLVATTLVLILVEAVGHLLEFALGCDFLGCPLGALMDILDATIIWFWKAVLVNCAGRFPDAARLVWKFVLSCNVLGCPLWGSMEAVVAAFVWTSKAVLVTCSELVSNVDVVDFCTACTAADILTQLSGDMRLLLGFVVFVERSCGRHCTYTWQCRLLSAMLVAIMGWSGWWVCAAWFLPAFPPKHDAKAAADFFEQPQPIQESPLIRHLVGFLAIPGNVVSAVLGALQETFGEGLIWELANAPWFSELDRWESLGHEIANDVSETSLEGGVAPLIIPLLQESIFAIARIITANIPQPGNLECTDDQMLNRLRRFGFQVGHGEVWGENDCLIDSLLQPLLLSKLF